MCCRIKGDKPSLGVRKGDGLFVHGSMKTIGGPRIIVETLLEAVGETGLIGMPGFSLDAYFPSDVERSGLTQEQIATIEDAVPGFGVSKSPTSGMGIISGTFRVWPGTRRSGHPAVSICLNGLNADDFLSEHSLAWATGEKTTLGKLRQRQSMKILLIGVGWNRCSALHTAETLAEHRRVKSRRFKNNDRGRSWIKTPDLADDMNRLFPTVGEAFEQAGSVSVGTFGDTRSKICDFSHLVKNACSWIDSANQQSGECC